MSTIFVIDAARRLLEKYQDKPELQDKGILLPVLSNFMRLIRMAITDYDRLTNMHPGDRRIPSENRRVPTD